MTVNIRPTLLNREAPARLAPVQEAEPPPGSVLSSAWKLCRMDLRLLLREPMVAFGMVGFPIVTVLVLAGVFGQVPDPDFGGLAPSDHYLAGYIAVVLGALGLITIPVHIATNRELGVLRRYRAAGIGARVLVLSELGLGAVIGTASVALVLATGTAVYGFSAPSDVVGVALWYLLGLVCFIAIGGALGMMMPSGRAAAAVGNMIYIPMFLLGGGGPPRAVMTGPMKAVSDAIPLTHIAGGLRKSWLGSTDDPHVAWWPLVVAAVAVMFAVFGARRSEG